MILIDPDLDPDRRQHSKAAPGAVWGRSRAIPWAERPPTPRTLAQFLAEALKAVRLRGEVSVLLTTDRAVRRLNRRFRGVDKTTDVLSFPADNSSQSRKRIPGKEKGQGQEILTGDLAISVDTARRQAAEQGHALSCELQVLILHGLLHLAGYDHEADDGRMARRERQLRARLGLPLGLIERARTTADPHSTPIARAIFVQGRLSPRSLRELAQDDTAQNNRRAGASRREAARIAQGGVRRAQRDGRNPGNVHRNRARRPGGPARTPATIRSRSR